MRSEMVRGIAAACLGPLGKRRLNEMRCIAINGWRASSSAFVANPEAPQQSGKGEAMAYQVIGERSGEVQAQGPSARS
jgi:hypothetical protein